MAVVLDDVVDGIFELVVRPNAQRLGVLAGHRRRPVATLRPLPRRVMYRRSASRTSSEVV